MGASVRGELFIALGLVRLPVRPATSLLESCERHAGSLRFLIFFSTLCARSTPEVENYRSRGGHNQDDGHRHGMSMSVDEANDLPSVTRRQERQDQVSGEPTERERKQEFSYRILHCTRGEQKWNHRHGRGQQSRNGNSAEAPTLEDFGNLVHFPAGEPALERFFSPLASKPVRDKASNYRTDRCHQGVVQPQLLLACRQDNRGHVHDARKRNRGVV
jgi:hypothetical protein